MIYDAIIADNKSRLTGKCLIFPTKDRIRLQAGKWETLSTVLPKLFRSKFNAISNVCETQSLRDSSGKTCNVIRKRNPTLLLPRESQNVKSLFNERQKFAVGRLSRTV